MRALVIVAVALALLAGAVAAFAPATLVAAYVDRASERAVALTVPEGTIWQGRATLATGTDRIPVRWTLSPWALPAGAVEIGLFPGDPGSRSPRAELRVARERITATSVDFALPAAVVPTAVARLTPVKMQWQADGQLSARSDRLEWQPGGWTGGVELGWRSARIVLAGMSPVALGDLSARLVASGDRLSGPVENRDGDLGVSGTIAVGARGSVNLSLLLTPRRADDAGLARVLGAIGTPEGPGWRVAWATR